VDSFRSVVVRRFELVCVLAPLPGRWSVLDVGCGTCRYGLALARLGAARVRGVDVSGAMLDIARAEIGRLGFDDRFELVQGDFLAQRDDERFEVALAMGYFDYLRDPLPHLAKLRSLCTGRLFASFPKRWEWRVPMRRLRFLLTRGFVRFYSHDEVRKLIERAGFAPDRVHLVDMGRDWVLVANCLPRTSSE
jgi:SAM-dependent methyltransferase